MLRRAAPDTVKGGEVGDLSKKVARPVGPRVTGEYCARCEEAHVPGAQIHQVYGKSLMGETISFLYCISCGRAKRVEL